MTKTENSKKYDLEERTFQFAKNVTLYVKKSPRTISTLEYGEASNKSLWFRRF